MDRYERLERIDYKSARDVVTEADHLSEALSSTRSGPLPGRRDPCRGDRGASGHRGRGAHLGAWPGLDRRPARRHRELRQRHPGLLRLDRAGRRRRAGGRGHPRPDAGRDVRGDRRRPGDPQRAPGPCLRQGQALRLRHLDVAQRPDRRVTRAGTSARRSGSRARWARRRSPSRTSPTAGSTPSSSRAGCRPGTSPRPG